MNPGTVVPCDSSAQWPARSGYARFQELDHDAVLPDIDEPLPDELWNIRFGPDTVDLRHIGFELTGGYAFDRFGSGNGQGECLDEQDDEVSEDQHIQREQHKTTAEQRQRSVQTSPPHRVHFALIGLVSHGAGACTRGASVTTTKAERLLLSRLSSAGTVLLSVHLALPEVPAWCDGTFGEICAFYEVDRPPGVFRYLARDPAFLQG